MYKKNIFLVFHVVYSVSNNVSLILSAKLHFQAIPLTNSSCFSIHDTCVHPFVYYHFPNCILPSVFRKNNSKRKYTKICLESKVLSGFCYTRFSAFHFNGYIHFHNEYQLSSNRRCNMWS